MQPSLLIFGCFPLSPFALNKMTQNKSQTNCSKLRARGQLLYHLQRRIVVVYSYSTHGHGFIDRLEK